MQQKHLLIAAAGTGGHVMPGLAVAREMKKRGWRITWIGTKKGMEGALVAKDGIDFIGLDFQGVRGHGILGFITGGIKLLFAGRRCRSLLKKLKPDVFFTTGGYVAVPVNEGARVNHIRPVLMNCDADVLLSTKMILKDAWGVACGFAGGARSIAGARGAITGNPVREDIESIEPPEDRLKGRSGRLKLLVFGGSLGAQVLNETLPKALSFFEEDKRPEVVHQCGVGSVEEVKKRYEALGVKAEVVGFIDDMAQAYRQSDLVICRAGATSVAELCAAGAASILVPLVVGTTSHQQGNARYMQRNSAAIMVEQPQFTPEHLFGTLMTLKREKIFEMAVNARKLSRPHATQAVADMIESVSTMRKRPY